ncbi:MAG: hypothetical protein BGO98_13675 [Myxococcales bacterium 68-20]|nr:MAG: hypothetical protein BGO98_13675 [Myxococcales bacterium 68-20]
MRGDEVPVVDHRVRLAELVEERVALGADAPLLAAERLGVDVAGGEDVHEGVLLLVERLELGAVGLGCLRARGLRFTVRDVERVSDRLGDEVVDGDALDGFAEGVEDVLLADVDLTLATIDVHALAVGAAVVAVLARVLARALRLRGERDLAATSRSGTRQRERPLVEKALVLQLAVGPLFAERGLQASPLLGGEDGLVLGLVPGVAPGELALEAIVRVRDARVEVLLQMLLDGRAVVARDHVRRDELLSEASLANAVEAIALEVEIHLASNEAPPFGRRSSDGAPALLRAPVLVEIRVLPVEGRRTARIPAVAAPLLHAVDRLALAGAVVLLRVRDADVEKEELRVVAVLVEDGPSARDVDDDLSLPNHLLEDLGIREVPRDAVPHVEDEVFDALGARFRDGGVELGPEGRLLRRLLERGDRGDGETGLARVSLLEVLLGIERDAVLLLSVADPTDEHRAGVPRVPPRRMAVRMTRLHGASFFQASSRRKNSTKWTRSAGVRGATSRSRDSAMASDEGPPSSPEAPVETTLAL